MQLQTIVHHHSAAVRQRVARALLGRFQARNPRGRVLLRPPTEPVLARAGGCAWRGGSGLHRGQARAVPAASCGAVGHIAKCDIAGASDTSIRNAEPNDIGRLLRESKITRIFATGGKSAQLYRKLIEPKTGVPSRSCPPPVPRTPHGRSRG